MRKKLFQGLAFVLLPAFVSACSSTGVTTRFYKKEKARVDQEINGNAGYIMGQPEEPVKPPAKKTRTIYVLEFTKQLDQPPSDEELYGMDLSEDKTRTDLQLPPRQKKKKVPAAPDISIPPLDEVEVDVPETAASVKEQEILTEYTVQEDDTLQKISKKFYDSYSKWHKIYEINKSVVKNPDFIKPGIVIKIPKLQQ